MAMLRSAMTNEAAMQMIRDLLVRQVFGPITELLGVPDAQLRATLVGSQFIGLGMMRYVSRLEPLASASIDELAGGRGADGAAVPHRRHRAAGRGGTLEEPRAQGRRSPQQFVRRRLLVPLELASRMARRCASSRSSRRRKMPRRAPTAYHACSSEAGPGRRRAWR